MAMTHRDDEHAMGEELAKLVGAVKAGRDEAWQDLVAEAEEMKAQRASTIAAGDEGEEALRQWEKYGVHVRELPERETDAKLNLCRVSIGFSPTEGFSYCSFRGPIREVKDVLRRALNALRDAP